MDLKRRIELPLPLLPPPPLLPLQMQKKRTRWKEALMDLCLGVDLKPC